MQVKPDVVILQSHIAELILAGLLPKYFSSEWSVAKFHLPEETQFIAAFGSQNILMIIGMDGRYWIDLITIIWLSV